MHTWKYKSYIGTNYMKEERERVELLSHCEESMEISISEERITQKSEI